MNPRPFVAKHLKDLAKLAFPNYKGRKFKVNTTGSVMLYNTNWCEGSRTYYTGVTLSGDRSQALGVPAPWDNELEGKTVLIAEGCAVISHCYFCGHDLGLTIHLPLASTQPALVNTVEAPL